MALRARKLGETPYPVFPPQRTGGLSVLFELFRQKAAARPPTLIRRGSALFSEDDRADGAYLLLSGSVKVSRLTPSGKEILLDLVGPGGVFGLQEALGGGRRGSAATALSDVRALRLEARELTVALGGSPGLLRDVLRHLLARLARVERRMELLMTLTVPRRLGHALLELSGAEDNGGARSVALTHQDMGNLVGTSRETVSLFLARFRQRGWVATERGRIRILDPKGLEEWLESDESPDDVALRGQVDSRHPSG